MYWAYHTLGVLPGASREEVKRNYRRLLMSYHPDRLLHAQQSDEEKRRDLLRFHEVQQAWEALDREFVRIEKNAA